MSESVLAATGLAKSFLLPDGRRLAILRDVNLELRRGESVAIMGVSGSGKTTLLHVLAGIEPADDGDVRRAGGRVGLVFQHHYLLPELSAEENVALAGRIAGQGTATALARGRELLAEVGLSERFTHLPSELSGGEMARVALARALIASPAVVLADEPTGNLDEDTSLQVQELLFGLVRRHGTALLIVTHEPAVAARADRTHRLEHGVLR